MAPLSMTMTDRLF